ncbi:MAG: S8 family peptidase [Gemmatimonadetes bacterium]|nr:S8 family peptidase [Gemmatimonadota bacterium]
MNRSLIAAASLLALGACADQSAGPVASMGEAPLLSASSPVDGSYIVVLKEGANPRSVAAVSGVSPRYVYGAALNGFAASLSAGQLRAMQSNPSVAYIEQDGVVHHTTVTQTNATWGLDRIDQRNLPLSTTFSYTNTGLGVNAYIVDTGIDIDHVEFAGRASHGFDAFADGQNGNDCNGHGTHVAGTTGGTVYGVAKAVKLVGVRVLNCDGSGTWSGVVAGIDWVAQNRVLPAVANMSLGGGYSQAVNDATTRLIDAGVATAVAAGNDGRDACKYSPASTPRAMTIGWTTRIDEKSTFSNLGDCVDWFAPGSGITAAWIGSGNTETNSISGTSMASPHAAGVAALYLQSNPGASPDAVRDALYAATTKGIVTRSRTRNNHLLYTAW